MNATIAPQTILIVDDEPPARRRLKAMLEGVSAFTVIAEAGDGASALSLNEQFKPDIVLLDIRMPVMDGIQVARHLAELHEPPAVIFCTAYDEYALAAFETNAVSYLLKPVSEQQLQRALQQASSLNRSQLLQVVNQLPSSEEQSDTRRCLSVKVGNHYKLIPIEDIRAFIASNKYVSAHFVSEGVACEAVLDQSLKMIEEQCLVDSACDFVRVHRNALVAKSFIVGLEKRSESYVLRLDRVSVEPVVSRRKLTVIKALLERL